MKLPILLVFLVVSPWSLAGSQGARTAEGTAVAGSTLQLPPRQESRVFDVREIVRAVPHYSAPELGVARSRHAEDATRPDPGHPAPAAPRGDKHAQALRESGEVLVSLAQAFMQPPAAPDAPAPRLEGVDKLFFRGSAEQLAWMEGFLALQARSHEELAVKATFLRVPASELAESGFEHGSVVKAKVLARQLERLGSLPGAEFLGSQTVTMLQRQRMAFSLTQEAQLIREGHPVDVIVQGTALEVAAARLDEHRLGLLVDARHARVVEPSGAGSPDIRHAHEQLTFSMLPGNSAVVILHPDSHAALVAVLTVELAVPR